MHETNERQGSNADPLAEIVRAAGRRVAPPQEHYDQVYAATHAVWQRKLGQSRQRYGYAIAAAIGLLAFGTLLWQILPTPVPTIAAELLVARGSVEQFDAETNAWMDIDAGGVVTLESRIRTGPDSATALRLSDGGSLRLSADTEVALRATGVDLDAGLLYFDSADRAAGAPIDIRTAHGIVRDIGTQFEVRSTSDALRVRIRSGGVELLDTADGNRVAGASGEELRLNAAGQLSRRQFARDDPDWAWVQSLAVAPTLETPSVMRYLTWIAEETGKELEFASETVRLQAELARFSGDPRGLMPADLLETIAETTDFDFEFTDHGTILITRQNQSE